MERLLYQYLNQATPFIIIFISIILGLVLDRVLYSCLKKAALKTLWEWDDVLVKIFKGKIKYFVIIIGFHIALPYSNLAKKTLDYVSNGLIVATIVVVTSIVASVSAAFLREYHRRGAEVRPVISILSTLVKGVVFFLGLLIILQYLGLSITPMLTALGVTGLAVALALQDTLSNIFAGIHIIVTRQIKVTDYIELDGGMEGYVHDITWRNTTIETLPGNMVIVPNSKLASSVITNYSLPRRDFNIRVQVGVSYDSDLGHVEAVTMETARKTLREVPEAVQDFEPLVRYHTFDDFSINFTVILRASNFEGKFIVKHEFIKRLHERYKEEGIVIPFPIRTVQIEKDGAS